ncbi:MAG: hypothetical protein OXG70_08165 [Cyanobacteria bacterium MAG IRC1_bin_28]|nr:hypothetical protein [Cyanobacteria bacterium MAG IRC1_bin_28]
MIADAGSVAVTVTDDDATTVTLVGAAGDMTEGGSKTSTVTLGRGLMNGESLAVPLSFSGGATRGTDYTMSGAAATGVTYQNLNSSNATVTFTGPESGGETGRHRSGHPGRQQRHRSGGRRLGNGQPGRV